MNRRGFLASLAGMAIGTAVAPAIVHASSIMRVRPILLPGEVTLAEINGVVAAMRAPQAAFNAAMSMNVKRWAAAMAAEAARHPLDWTRLMGDDAPLVRLP